jgi:cbb3-type cytochrome oxidase subunit 1
VPALTVWGLRIALGYLGVGFTLGALMLAARGLALAPTLLRLRPLHMELLLIGWMVQLALAVAYWILPRRPGWGRVNEPLAWGALLLLNLGVLTVGVAGVLGAPSSVLIAGRSAELLAALGFAAHAWPRIRAYSLRNPLP